MTIPRIDPPITVEEFKHRREVVRRAKVAKERREGDIFLTDAELAPLFPDAPVAWSDRRKRNDSRPILPCVVCGDPGGRSATKCSHPGRCMGGPFGIAGEICLRCWHRLDYRRKRGGTPAAPAPAPEHPWREYGVFAAGVDARPPSPAPSPVSFAHAAKVAVEKRHAWLRTGGASMTRENPPLPNNALSSASRRFRAGAGADSANSLDKPDFRSTSTEAPMSTAEHPHARPPRRQSLTTGVVARVCDVAPRTVSKWIDGGLLVGWRIPSSSPGAGGKDRRVDTDVLVAFLEEHRMAAARRRLEEWLTAGGCSAD